MQRETIFDIADGKNRYEPCPKCGMEFAMGTESDGRSQAVTCGNCGHKGPGIEQPPQGQWETWPVKWHERDRLAFEAWNDASRRERGPAVAPDNKTKGSKMIDRLQLAKKISDFLDAHARTAASYDPECDDPGDRFNGPDSAMLYAAAERLKAGAAFQLPFSSWGSGCYQPIHDKQAKAMHDEIIDELRLCLRAEHEGTPNGLPTTRKS